MSSKGMGIRVLAVLAVTLAAAAAPAGDELTPERRRQLEQEARQLNEQAFTLYGRGKLPEAVAAAEKALTLRRRLHPKDHPDLAVSLNNLGGMLLEKGDLPGAERHFREALAIHRRLYPKGHRELAQGEVQTFAVPGDHDNNRQAMMEPYVEFVSERLSEYLGRREGESEPRVALGGAAPGA